jgi:RimJ/RimL family protein N-acetyltransferase
MFGFPMQVKLDGVSVTLRPFKQNEMEGFANLFGSMLVHKYTMGMSAKTADDEIEWWKRCASSQSDVTWAIVAEGCDTPIGTTGLHGIHMAWGCCHSGIVIADRNYWHKGIAYRAHLARTLYAANTLGRVTIQSSVRTPNEGSLKALLKVGYRVSGKHDRDVFRDGAYLDTYILSWVNPNRVSDLYPAGVPEELSESLKRADDALKIAKETVTFI